MAGRIYVRDGEVSWWLVCVSDVSMLLELQIEVMNANKGNPEIRNIHLQRKTQIQSPKCLTI